MSDKNGFQLTEKQRDALMEQVYGGYVRNPATVSGNKATQGQRAPHRNAGQIDYGAYGGSASDDFMDQRYENYRNSKYYDPDRKTTFKRDGYGERWRNRETWQQVAKHLGIKNVNSESDLRQMYDFVRGYEKKEKKDDDTDFKPSPLPEDPYKGKNKPVGYPNKKDMPGAGDFGTNRPPGSIAYIPPSSDEGREAYGRAGFSGKTSLDTAIESVADYGNRATDDYFGRFLPEMGRRNTNEAKATGRSILKGIQDFTGKIPELGDPKKLFDYYMGKID